MIRTYLFTLLSMVLLAGPAFGQSAKDIIRQAENTRRGIESSQAEMTMTIVRPDWTREMSMKSWSKGDDYALMLVTAPARDAGMATLKRGNEVWNWVPRIERTIKLPRSMMSQSWMGSDFTNNDLVQEVSIIDDYDHRIVKDSTVEGRSCWKIELIPHEDAAVVWGKIYAWIDKADYLTLRNEFYDEDGYLINVMQSSNIQKMGGRTFATKLEMIPVEEEGHKTVLQYQNIQFDVAMDDDFFSVQNMKRLR